MEIKTYLGAHAKLGWGQLILSNYKYAPYFIIVALLLPNLLFAFYHWFRSGGLGADPQPIWLWITQGPFMVFVISGIILTLIGMKYGWTATILTHGCWNAMVIMLAAVSSGGLS